MLNAFEPSAAPTSLALRAAIASLLGTCFGAAMIILTAF